METQQAENGDAADYVESRHGQYTESLASDDGGEIAGLTFFQ